MGEVDCFSIFRDIYRENFGIEIRDYARPHDWNSDRFDIIEAAYEREGFVKLYDWSLKDLLPGDVLCMAIGRSQANHFAVYVGDNTIAHHVHGQLSRTDPMREFWRRSTVYVLRHPLVPDTRPERGVVTIQELNDERTSFPPQA